MKFSICKRNSLDDKVVELTPREFIKKESSYRKSKQKAALLLCLIEGNTINTRSGSYWLASAGPKE